MNRFCARIACFTIMGVALFLCIRWARGWLHDGVVTRYATLHEARVARAFERGWLPPLLPDSARDIRESNDLDVNVGNGAFAFDPGELESYLKRLRDMRSAVCK